MLLAEAPPEDGIGACGHAALWRCVTCHTAPALCAQCCLDSHQRHPFHRIQFWAADHYRSASLRELGLYVHCGHGGATCPRLDSISQQVEPEVSDPVADEEDIPEEPALLEEDESDYDDEDDDLYYDPRPDVLPPDVRDLPHPAPFPTAPVLN